jgi:murein DD-endopeptidase MepM/ murein hydrolase activator NlpD
MIKVAALVLSGFSGLHAGGLAAEPGLNPTIVGRPDSLTLSVTGAIGAGLVPELGPEVSESWLLPESSAADEVSSDLVFEDEPVTPVIFSGCELRLGGSLAPDAWARDLWLGAPPARFVENGHTERDGHWLDYEQIPRRPERPEEYAAYRYPVADAPVVSGYDLDKPDEAQRRGATLSHVGHGGVDLPQKKGEPVRMIALDHQQGPAEVIYTGPLFGTTVLTRQTLREGGELRDYVLLFGHLDAVAPGVVKGKQLEQGDLVGFVGDTGSPELVHLHLEARRVRDGIDLSRYDAGAIIRNEVTVVCDPRNVLPLK